MTARSLARLARAALLERRARRSARRAGVVLVYHRIGADSGSSQDGLNRPLDRSTFARELAYLGRRYRIVAPSAFPDALERREPGGRLPVSLTFDDDTASQLTHAAPALDERGFTGGFFVGGWTLAGRARPWWETLQLALDHDRIPAGVPLPAELLAAAAQRRPGAIRELGLAVERLDAGERATLEEALAAATAELPGDPGLDADALRALANRHEIGFHTLAHDRLVALADEELTAALSDGRDELAAAVGRPVTTLAYPHGAADERVAAAARSTGYAIGFAGGNRAASAKDDRLLVPRLDPWHGSLGTFAITLATAVIEAADPPR